MTTNHQTAEMLRSLSIDREDAPQGTPAADRPAARPRLSPRLLAAAIGACTLTAGVVLATYDWSSPAQQPAANVLAAQRATARPSQAAAHVGSLMILFDLPMHTSCTRRHLTL